MDDGDCVCSEQENQVSQTIDEFLGGQTITEYIGGKITEWEIEEKIKKIIPSRCAMGDDGEK